jgi:phosphatidylinositol kinase/protein kinase (PI-3  family)
VKISGINHILKIIPSAKRPRKIRMLGSDSRSYKYLLKGTEDLRLDQRVMQLFSLTNSLLRDDKFGIALRITLVPIVPLGQNGGLIAWAEKGETLAAMIEWHRRIIHIDPGMEMRYLNKNFVQPPDEQRDIPLNHVQKLEFYRELMESTPDDNLREAIWLRSLNAEKWVHVTTDFARSMSLMSIVGYIMGIGDRHPSNILVMKGSGDVVHIDFSDCFEKANLRKYVSETVPFRLTRMIVKALGGSGVYGPFAMTAEYVMGLMRRNRETLMAFLDIFVQDPVTDTLWYQHASPSFFGGHNVVAENVDGVEFKKAMMRVNGKLSGREFGEYMTPRQQVWKLISMATNEYNLAVMYFGWSPFW